MLDLLVAWSMSRQVSHFCGDICTAPSRRRRRRAQRVELGSAASSRSVGRDGEYGELPARQNDFIHPVLNLDSGASWKA